MCGLKDSHLWLKSAYRWRHVKGARATAPPFCTAPYRLEGQRASTRVRQATSRLPRHGSSSKTHDSERQLLPQEGGLRNRSIKQDRVSLVAGRGKEAPTFRMGPAGGTSTTPHTTTTRRATGQQRQGDIAGTKDEHCWRVKTKSSGL